MSSYSYDSFGNITEIERPNSAGVTVKNTYSYENSSWRDLLTAYNGHTITYDKIGNPLSYYNGRSYTLRWEMGRQLLSSRVNSRTVYYDYNKDGMRIKKNVSGRYTDRYILDGSKVIGMERTKSGSSVKDVYHFIYDEMGNIWSAICYIGGSTTPVRYFYRTNAQGDVKQIVDSNYNVVAYYAYDAWGKLLAVLDGNDNPITDSSHFAIVNPFRYRGYIYDTETGFYYLQSRYYDPEIGRFINADGYVTTDIEPVAANMFAYCDNCPTIYSDYSGKCKYNGTKADFDRLNRGLPSMNCKCNYSEPVYVVSTKGGDLLQIYDSVESSENISDWTRKNTVRAVDARGADDPNVQVRESAMISEQIRMTAIISELLNYNELYPVSPEWSRTKESMMIEWDAHNTVYNIYNNERCLHVDFNNADEPSRKIDYYIRAGVGVIGYVFG